MFRTCVDRDAMDQEIKKETTLLGPAEALPWAESPKPVSDSKVLESRDHCGDHGSTHTEVSMRKKVMISFVQGTALPVRPMRWWFRVPT